MCRRLLVSAFCFLLSAFGPARADLPVPPQVLDPQTAAEAWNVIRLATANVQRLLKERRLDEIPQQISLCSPALRTLSRSATSTENRQRIDMHSPIAFRLVNDIAQNSMARLQSATDAAFARLQAELKELQPAFSEQDVRAEIHFCPQHPEMMSADAKALCRVCQGPLRVRRIPYTDLFAATDTPLVRLKLTAAEALKSGTPVSLKASLLSADDKHFPTTDLLPFHSATVRLFLVDPTLADFHLLTPAAGTSLDVLTASFTPATAGPYRVWAEVVPAQTALSEHPFADLGGAFNVVDRSKHDFIDALDVTAGGFRFQLTFTAGNGGAPPARQVSVMRLQVSDSTNQSVTRLEPLMNAFAHLTGIYDDGKTVLRLHPVGGDILRDDLRGGPSLNFKIYPPQTGFLRLFCQVRLDGRIITAPLGVQITK